MDAITLLIQIPLVGIFVWYSIEMSKRGEQAQKAFLEALDKRDSEFEKRNQAIIVQMDNLQKFLVEHDKQAASILSTANQTLDMLKDRRQQPAKAAR